MRDRFEAMAVDTRGAYSGQARTGIGRLVRIPF